MKKKNYKFPVGNVITIIVSFALAVLDMLFLWEAIQLVFRQDALAAMLFAFALASLANFSALKWGQKNGKEQNKKWTGSAWLWVIIGAVYAIIRAAKIWTLLTTVNSDFSLPSELFQIAMLAIFYIFTGTEIRSCSREIYDADAQRYRKTKKEFELYHREVARMEKPIVKDLAILKDYANRYESLDRQKEEIENGIRKTENATAYTIEGLVKKHNPIIDSAAAHKAVEDTLDAARKKTSKKLNEGK